MYISRGIRGIRSQFRSLYHLVLISGFLLGHVALCQTLTVRVEGIHGKHGRLRVGIWNSPVGFPSVSPLRSVWVDCSVIGGDTDTVVFHDLPKGEYAVAAMHDENGNGKLDTNVFGKPKEGWAVSNNVSHRMRAPTYDEAKFQLSSSGDAVLSLSLIY